MAAEVEWGNAVRAVLREQTLRATSGSRSCATKDKRCAETKDKGVREIVVADPWVLGDNYEELVESLSRLALADAGLSLHIAGRKDWPSRN